MNSEPAVKAIEKVLPAVVNITMAKEVKAFQQRFSFGSHLPSQTQKRKKMETGGGSGFIVESHGIILTNRHVIEDPTATYLVTLQNGEKVTSEILARDLIHDIAILKINKRNLPTAKLGDSSHLKLGQTVIAIGNALSFFKNTVSQGVISGLSREIEAQSETAKSRSRLRGLIQTDAAINPGNSGGPLIDLGGEVIGITAAMVFGAENIAFALPINTAKKDLEDLKKYGRIIQPFLGVRYISITGELKKSLGLPVDYGALVVSGPNIGRKPQRAVIPNSPAERAGIKETDIILELNKTKITPELSLSEILDQCQVGQEIELKILRKNKKKIVKAVLTER